MAFGKKNQDLTAQHLEQSEAKTTPPVANDHANNAATSAREQQPHETTKRGYVPPKGRPTPKASESAEAHKRPLGGVPAKKRRSMTKQEREADRQRREQIFQAMKRGDENALPQRDKGPVRGFIRDYVDARWNLGEFFLPFALVFVALTFVAGKNEVFVFYILLGIYAVVLLTIVDAMITWRQIKKRLRSTFGEDVALKGSAFYCITRIYQIRRSRMPAPRVLRGQYPE